MSLAKWCAISSAFLIVGAGASWWIPSGIAGRPNAPQLLANQTNDIGANIVPPIASRVVAEPQPLAQDDDAIRKAGLAMLQRALQAGAPGDAALAGTKSPQPIVWPTPSGSLEPGDAPDTSHDTLNAPRSISVVGNERLATAAEDTELPAVRSLGTASEVHRVKHIGHKAAVTAKPHRVAQEEAVAPKPHKSAQPEYIERIVEQGDAGAVTYKDVRRRCEPGNMVDVCFMPAKNRRDIVIERY